MSQVYNFTADEGDTFLKTLTITNSADAPVSYAGYTCKMHVRTKIEDTTPIVDATTANGKAVVQGVSNNEIKLEFSLAGIAAGKYIYSLVVISPTAVPTTLMRGEFTIRANATR